MRDFGSYYRDPVLSGSIQVLKGPASILFGRGSTGGVVEQDSKLPKLGPFGDGTLIFGTDLTTAGHRRRQSSRCPHLGEGAALRLNAMVHDSQRRRPRRRAHTTASAWRRALRSGSARRPG